MRRADREMKDINEIIKVMEKCDTCRLALNDEEYPYILPLNFGMEIIEGKIILYFHGATEGKKCDIKNNGNAIGCPGYYRKGSHEEKILTTFNWKSDRQKIVEELWLYLVEAKNGYKS